MAKQRMRAAASRSLKSSAAKATRVKSAASAPLATAKRSKRDAEYAEARALLDSFEGRLAEAHAQIDAVLRSLKPI